MAHNNSEEILSPVEREYKDIIQHADDFFKIELLRPAKKWYTKALELNIENEKVKQRIAECDKLLALERKVIWILTAVVVVIVLFLVFS
jgi:hypothetical protein